MASPRHTDEGRGAVDTENTTEPSSPLVTAPPAAIDFVGPTVLVVGAHTMVTTSLAQSMTATGSMRAIAADDDPESAVRIALAHHCDVAVIDVTEGLTNSRQLTVALRTACPVMAIIALGADADPVVVAPVIAAGAIGYLMKTQSLDSLVAAIAEVRLGRPVIAPELMGTMLDHLANGTPTPALTERQRRILELLALGTDTRQMANHFQLTLNTMRNQIRSVIVRLGAHSKLEAVTIGLRSGLIAVPAATTPSMPTPSRPTPSRPAPSMTATAAISMASSGARS